MTTCPKCRRPFNEGNSPNAAECNGTDDDEGLCEAYAKVAILRVALVNLLDNSAVITPPDGDPCFVDLQIVAEHYEAAYEAVKDVTREDES